MFDIDHILGNKKQPKVKSPVFNLMGFNTRHFIIKDRVTKPQRKIIKSNNWMKMWTDSDGDGVINALDCQPRNKKKHMAFVRKSGVSFVDSPSPMHYVRQTEMSPDEYLTKSYELHKRRTLESGRPWQYSSVQDYTEKNTSPARVEEYKEKIRNPNLTMDAPWLEYKNGVLEEQEGRNRAYSAKQLNEPKIPVNIVETNPKSYFEKQARAAVYKIKEVDSKGICKGACTDISREIANSIPGAEVAPMVPEGSNKRHNVVKVGGYTIDTQWKQYKPDQLGKPTPEGVYSDLPERDVVFESRQHRKLGFTDRMPEESIDLSKLTDVNKNKPHAPNNNDGGKQ